jgi:hypothetical protein
VTDGPDFVAEFKAMTLEIERLRAQCAQQADQLVRLDLAQNEKPPEVVRAWQQGDATLVEFVTVEMTYELAYRARSSDLSRAICDRLAQKLLEGGTRYLHRSQAPDANVIRYTISVLAQ